MVKVFRDNCGTLQRNFVFTRIASGNDGYIYLPVQMPIDLLFISLPLKCNISEISQLFNQPGGAKTGIKRVKITKNEFPRFSFPEEILYPVRDIIHRIFISPAYCFMDP